MNRTEVQTKYEDIPGRASDDDDDDDDDDGDDDIGSPSSCALIGQLTEDFWTNDRAYFIPKRGK